jgi:hypothetical protein
MRAILATTPSAAAFCARSDSGTLAATHVNRKPPICRQNRINAPHRPWSTEAEANTYVQKSWPSNYSSPRPRPRLRLRGGNLGTSAGRDPENSYLWDALFRAGVSFRNYGFFATGTIPAVVAPTEPELAAHTDVQYPGYNLNIPDQTRIAERLREFQGFVASATLPTFEFVRLPNDHTSGTRVGAPTLKAMVADNDLGPRQARRRGLTLALLVVDGDLRDRGRRPERAGPRGRAPHDRAGDQPVHADRECRLDLLQHRLDAPHHGARRGRAPTHAVRRTGRADESELHVPARLDAVHRDHAFAGFLRAAAHDRLPGLPSTH